VFREGSVVTVSVYSRNPFRRDYCMGKVFINPENAGHGMLCADVLGLHGGGRAGGG
jgi:hypothetical protein